MEKTSDDVGDINQAQNIGKHPDTISMIEKLNKLRNKKKKSGQY